MNLRPSSKQSNISSALSPLRKTNLSDLEIQSTTSIRPPTNHLLSEWPATAIAANDLLSSLFYTIGICANISGKWMPLALFLVSCILFPFKKIYAEIAGSVPSNGGTFNLITKLYNKDEETSPTTATVLSPVSADFMVPKRVNPVGKILAAIAGTLSLLSYISTAVVSSASAIVYGASEFKFLQPYIFPLTLFIILLFGLITMSGMKESSSVALSIFFLHCISLVFLLVSGIIHAVLVENFEVFFYNFSKSDAEMAEVHVGLGTPLKNLYFGVCSALLGITGFETSSNYIEQQGPGVFPKTLWNMWLLVTIFNPAIGFMSLGIANLSDVPKAKDNFLSLIAEIIGGRYLRLLIAIDAVLALSGGALTAYIGVTGLVTRMTQENMFPKWLMSKNSFAGTNHWIILIFMFISCSLYIITGGNISSLGGVFTVSFLSVLIVSILGCVALRKINQKPLWTSDILVALIGVVSGIVGQLILFPENIFYFCQYFFIVFSFITIYMKRQGVF